MTETNSNVESFFDTLSEEYTTAIERCFPRYREMLCVLLDYLPKPRQLASILELGCGTGNLTVLLRDICPAAEIEVVDLSGESLAICRSRIGSDARFRYEQRDFRELDFASGSFDLVVSSIAIHHLRPAEKRSLFQQIHGWLRPQGIFTYADQFRGATDDLYARHIANWKTQSLAAGSTPEEFEMWMQHQRESDYHDTLQDQLDWIRDAGFPIVDCQWRFLLWSVVQARKS